MGRAKRVRLRGRPVGEYVASFNEWACEHEFTQGKWAGYICGEPAAPYITLQFDHQWMNASNFPQPASRCDTHARQDFGEEFVQRWKERRDGNIFFTAQNGKLVPRQATQADRDFVRRDRRLAGTANAK